MTKSAGLEKPDGILTACSTTWPACTMQMRCSLSSKTVIRLVGYAYLHPSLANCPTAPVKVRASRLMLGFAMLSLMNEW